jgi:DNA gyrase subunit A
VRTMGRGASGVRAIRLRKSDHVIGAVVLRRAGTTILIATEGGFGKRSQTDEYRITRRGGKGIITVKTNEKTGRMMAIKEVMEKDDVVIVTSRGVVIRQHVSDIRVAGRNTQGVRLIRLDSADTVADLAAVPAEDDEPGEGGESNGVKPPANPVEEKQIDLFSGTKEKGSAKGAKKPPPAKKGKRRS